LRVLITSSEYRPRGELKQDRRHNRRAPAEL